LLFFSVTVHEHNLTVFVDCTVSTRHCRFFYYLSLGFCGSAAWLSPYFSKVTLWTLLEWYCNVTPKQQCQNSEVIIFLPSYFISSRAIDVYLAFCQVLLRNMVW